MNDTPDPIRTTKVEENAAQQQFLTLFLRSEREIYRYVAALIPIASEAEDIVQQTAVALWERFDAYDPSKPFTPWACGFALNKARHWIERHQKWKRLLDHGLAEKLLKRREELQPATDDRLRHLGNCIDKLPERHRVVLKGYYHQRLDMDTLAKTAKCSVAATYKLLQRVRHALQACVEDAVGREGLAG